MKKFFLISSLCLTLFVSSNASSHSVEALFACNDSTDDCVSFDFRWLEFQNVLFSKAVRHIEIFMDERAFSEKNLRALFVYLSKKNPKPGMLTISVRTSWAQLEPYSDCGDAISGEPDKPDRF